MAKYRVSVLASAALTNAPIAAIRAGARRLKIKQITLILTTAVQSQIGVARTATVGTASASTTPPPLDSNDAVSDGAVDTAWSAAPTVAATPIYFERATIANAIGNGVVWTFIDPLVVEPSASVALWNFAASSSGDIQVSVLYED